MLLQKTDKARLELSPGVRTLSLRERSLLLLADGKTLSALQAMYSGTGAQMVDKLMRQGYLTGPAASPGTSRPDQASSAFEPADAPASANPSAHANPPAPVEALRSLPGSRMYLFDICERIFARRDPALAQHFREALRAARDHESMLHVGAALLAEVARMAGPERADTIRERLAQLLPRERMTATALGA